MNRGRRPHSPTGLSALAPSPLPCPDSLTRPSHLFAPLLGAGPTEALGLVWSALSKYSGRGQRALLASNSSQGHTCTRPVPGPTQTGPQGVTREPSRATSGQGLARAEREAAQTLLSPAHRRLPSQVGLPTAALLTLLLAAGPTVSLSPPAPAPRPASLTGTTGGLDPGPTLSRVEGLTVPLPPTAPGHRTRKHDATADQLCPNPSYRTALQLAG